MKHILTILFATTAIAAPVSHQVDEHLRLVASDYGGGNTTATTLDASGNVLSIAVRASTSPGGLFDRDNDGMRDLWEIQRFGSIALGNPASDADGDGMNNLVEHALATDPQQASALPSHAVVANRLQLSFTLRLDAVNLRYDIEALSAASNQWDVIATGINSDAWSVTNPSFTVNESATATAFNVTASIAIVQPMPYTRMRVKITGPTLSAFTATDDAGIQPRFTAYSVNQAAAETTSRTVTLSHTLSTDGAPTPTDYRASEDPTFTGAAWQSYTASPSFLLSSGNGTKTVYFQTRFLTQLSAVSQDTITLNMPPFATWKDDYFGTSTTNTGNTQDFDGDGIPNISEFAFGTLPNSNASGPAVLQYTGTFAGGGAITATGQPITAFESVPNGVDFRALFVRRPDYVTAGLTYTPQFSANLVTWQNSTAAPVVLSDNGIYQIVSVPYPTFIAGKKARFFRVSVSIAP